MERTAPDARARMGRGVPSRRWLRRTAAGSVTCLAAAALTGTAAVATGGVAHAQPMPVSQQFLCTGGIQPFVVPDAVTSVDVVAIGAPGGNLASSGIDASAPRGRGAQVTATLTVTPGEELLVYVGCPGERRLGGFNGGGNANEAQFGGAGAGGGGASDIRRGTTSLDARVIVAGGGGGGGGMNTGESTNGGAGGVAGADGGNAAGTTNSRGRAGTQTAGGAGGIATGTSSQGNPQNGTSGQLGRGGNGGAYGVNTPGRGGGGGGGGLFGGGGGGGGGGNQFGEFFGGGGGGGGSSLVPAGGSMTVVDNRTAPSVTITYETSAAPREADLAIDKTAGPDAVVPGDEITYTLAVTNNGPAEATSVIATDVLPAGVSFVSASDGCFDAAGTVTCELGVLTAGDGATAEIVVRADAVISVSNTASVAGDQADPDATNDSDTAVVVIDELPTVPEPMEPETPAVATCAGVLATIVGTPGADMLNGTPGRDVIAGLGGSDVVDGGGGGGDDLICGDDGIDALVGGAGDDRILGGADLDLLSGGPGADALDGGGGLDLCDGADGSDTAAGCEFRRNIP